MINAGKIRRTLFGIPSEKAVFSRPGFAKEAWLRFQPVAHSLVEGYHASLEDSRFEVLVPRLNAMEPELHGFAYEGAGMGLAALDCIAPWKKRVNAFVSGPAAAHIYPTYVGVGLALARLHRHPEHFLSRLDPLLNWVIVDGYGFHEGFFARARTIGRRTVPTHLSAYGRRLFDQGLGRCIWFSSGARVDLVVATIAPFVQERQADLWSGVSMACAFAGGTDRAGIQDLLAQTKPYRSQMAAGVAIAAKGHQKAGQMGAHTELACQLICGLSSTETAQVADTASENIPFDAQQPAYEIWRQRLRTHFSTYLKQDALAI